MRTAAACRRVRARACGARALRQGQTHRRPSMPGREVLARLAAAPWRRPGRVDLCEVEVSPRSPPTPDPPAAPGLAHFAVPGRAPRGPVRDTGRRHRTAVGAIGWIPGDAACEPRPIRVAG